MDNLPEVIAELSARRRESGLSQTEVAARMGTSQSAVARLESGDGDVRASTLDRYAAAIGHRINMEVQGMAPNPLLIDVPGRPWQPAPAPFRPEPVASFSGTAAFQVPDPVAERLFERRIVLAHGELTEERGTAWCGQLLTLGAAGRAPITLHVSIPDGDLGAALTLMDTLDALTVEVHAMVTGRLGGPALGLLDAVTSRRASPGAIIRLGEPKVTASGNADQLATAEEETRRMLDTLYLRLSRLTGREPDEVRADARRGRLLSAAEAVDYGLLDSLTEGRA